MRLIILLCVSVLAGCTAVDVSNEDFAEGIINQCYELTEVGQLILARGSNKERVLSFSLEYFFLSVESQTHYREQDAKQISLLEPGNRLKIQKIINYRYGSVGDCWVVKTDLLDFDTAGRSVEIPSCFVWDRPIWVEPGSPHAFDNGIVPLRINTPALRHVECP